MTDNTLVITGRARASYAHIAEPQPPMTPGGKEAYSITLIIPKSDTATIQALRDAQEAAKEKKWGSKRPKMLLDTIKDGDKQSVTRGDGGVDVDKHPEYADSWVVTARNTRKVGVIDRKKEFIDESAIYSGCYVKAALQAFAYDRPDGKGTTFSLKTVQFLADGEPFGAANVSVDLFGDDDDDEEDDDDVL